MNRGRVLTLCYVLVQLTLSLCKSKDYNHIYSCVTQTEIYFAKLLASVQQRNSKPSTPPLDQAVHHPFLKDALVLLMMEGVVRQRSVIARIFNDLKIQGVMAMLMIILLLYIVVKIGLINLKTFSQSLIRPIIPYLLLFLM